MKNAAPGLCAQAAFADFFRKHAKALRNYLYFKFGDRDQADDMTQEAFAKLWEKCGDVPMEKAKSFVYTVANNASLNKIAHRKVVLTHAKMHAPETATHYDPQFLIEEDQFRVKLEAAIANLTEGQRTAFLLNRIEGKKYHEIAEMLGLSVKAVEKRIHGALVSLRENLGRKVG